MRSDEDAAPEGITVKRDAGWAVPVVRGWSSQDDDELLAYLVADNRQTELGGWDERVLADILGDLVTTEGLVGVGYNEADLEKMRGHLAPPPPPEFKNVDPANLGTEYECPSCGYEWSGQAKPGTPAHEPASED